MVNKSPRSGRNRKGTTDTNACGPKEEESSKIQTRNCGIERNKKVSKVIGTTYTMNAVSKTGKGDSSGSQSVCAFPKWHDIGFTGIRGGLPGGIVGRF